VNRALLLASAAIGVAILPLGAAQAADQLRPAAFDWSGFYAGIHGGWLVGDVNVHEELAPTGGEISGTVLGVLAGYNFFYPQAAPWLLGVEADAGWANVHGNGVVDVSCDYLYDLNWDAHLRLRASYPEGGAVTPFLAAGLALANLDITETCGPSSGGLFFGGTVGGGFDFNAGQNMTLRGEVLYDFYGNKRYTDFSANFTAWTARVAVLWRFR
jgi:outer membrane immunogenic protein